MDWSRHRALITGAGSGIGQALAKALHDRGAALILTDIDAERLAATKTALTGLAQVTTLPVDVSDPRAIKALAGDLSGDPPTALFNNAGVAVGGEFSDVSEADFDWLLSINLMGPIRMTRAFLPTLRQAPDALIVNISSLFGLIAPAGQTAYCASKFGLRGFSDSLRHELSETSVRIVTVHPGGVKTRIARDARMPTTSRNEDIQSAADRFLVMPPAEAADIILRGIERGKRRILVGRDAKFAALVERLFPDSYWSRLRTISKS